MLQSPGLRERLKHGCRDAAILYTLDNMVDRFAGGLDQALMLSK